MFQKQLKYFQHFFQFLKFSMVFIFNIFIENIFYFEVFTISPYFLIYRKIRQEDIGS